ncbi:transketolase-like TK C-terminal-containing protein [Mycoplasmopsis hyopharyngis]|uniref:transketolase-like TK C-terminal-containing protein n=1 Tax=Mycoplasmopsis hyopharyngis TaxID=29558 RepID=UPI00387398E9
MNNLDKKAIATMRGLAIDSINMAKGGHLGMAIGAAPITYSLYTKILNLNLEQPKWINRDRFVLSAGHGSMSIYSIMNLLGILSIDDLKKHKTFGSKTPSHPEIENSFIEASTGPLGQGIAMSVGMAISQKYLANQFNKPNYPIFDHYVYALHGDGCIQEGVSAEALQLAGTLKLDKLIIIHDFNNAQIDTKSEVVNNIDTLKYFEAFNFATFEVKEPTVENIVEAINKAKASKKPSYIKVHTKIAEFTPMENSPKGHNGTLNPEQTITFKKKMNLEELTPFVYDKNVYSFVQESWKQKNEVYKTWKTMFDKYQKDFPQEFKKLQALSENKFQYDFEQVKTNIKNDNLAIRDYFEPYIKHIENNYWNVVGGSADLASATKINFSKAITENGQGIHYGIREFAMSAINNGIYLDNNLRTVDSTFLAFADYAKAAIRLGAMMHIPAIHFYTHDSYLIGGDGPTHQPFDQIPMLRATANVRVYRPCNLDEVHYSFTKAFSDLANQSIIVGTRQAVETDKKIVFNNEKGYGQYLQHQDFDVTILASGSEVDLALKIESYLLKHNNIKSQIISVPCLQEFINNDKLIRELKINKKPIFVIEATSDSTWFKLAKYNKLYTHLALTFGYSADGLEVYKRKGFGVKNLALKIVDFLENIEKSKKYKVKNDRAQENN